MRVNITVEKLGGLDIEMSEKSARELLTYAIGMTESNNNIEDAYRSYCEPVAEKGKKPLIYDDGKIQKVDVKSEIMFYRCSECGKNQYMIGSDGDSAFCGKCGESVTVSDYERVEYNCKCGQSQEVLVKGDATVQCKSCRSIVDTVRCY